MASDNKLDKVTSTTDSMGPIEHIAEAEASIRANAGPKGLSPQQRRALTKLRTAAQLLGGVQNHLT